jgi:hypothetical protein
MRMAVVGGCPALPMEQLAGTDCLAALEAAGLACLAEPATGVCVTRRWVLYDFDRDCLVTSRLYESYTDGADEASRLNDVLVLPIVISEEIVAAAGPFRRQAAPAKPRPRLYRLTIDGPLLDRQREVLLRVTDLAQREVAYTPTSGEDELLNGLLELTDALADQCPGQP